MTVEDNLALGFYTRRDLDAVLSLSPRLRERNRRHEGTLSGGEQQMLTIGRALMEHPKSLLLDEPSLGHAPKLVEEILETIERIRSPEVWFLLVERNVGTALSIADHGYVLELGEIRLSGRAAELQANPAFQEACLRT